MKIRMTEIKLIPRTEYHINKSEGNLHISISSITSYRHYWNFRIKSNTLILSYINWAEDKAFLNTLNKQQKIQTTRVYKRVINSWLHYLLSSDQMNRNKTQHKLAKSSRNFLVQIENELAQFKSLIVNLPIKINTNETL